MQKQQPESTNTIRTYRVVLRHLSSYLNRSLSLQEKTAWREIDPKDLSGFFYWLTKQRSYKRSTLEVYLATVHTIGHLLQLRQRITDDVAQAFASLRLEEAHSGVVKKELIPCRLTPAIVEQWLSALPDDLRGLRDQLLISLLCEHGVNAEHLVRLQVQHLDLAKNRLYLSLEKRQEIMLLSHTATIVQGYLQQWPLAQKGNLLRGIHRNERLLSSISTKTLRNIIQNSAYEVLGLRDITPRECLRFYRATHRETL